MSSNMEPNRLKKEIFLNLETKEQELLSSWESDIKNDYKRHFIRLFSTINRHIPHDFQVKRVSIAENQESNLIVEDWDLSRLIRVWLISLISKDIGKEAYVSFIEDLFQYGDMQELIALYSALPIFHYAESWKERCSEGIRNNIEGVQEAVALNNKYPFVHLNQNAWNQLILKSFFTQKDILKIYRWEDRMDDSLAHAVEDYIYERYAAKRAINPFLWVFVASRMNEKLLEVLKETFEEYTSELEKLCALFAIIDLPEDKVDDLFIREKEAIAQPITMESILKYKNK